MTERRRQRRRPLSGACAAVRLSRTSGSVTTFMMFSFMNHTKDSLQCLQNTFNTPPPREERRKAWAYIITKSCGTRLLYVINALMGPVNKPVPLSWCINCL